ncbi:MAG: MBL fold metallo-hydrolase [Deltaproteobacteria bacterium]|nr:MBL fold metallo-hydrolase [Deltaproteobacteria bacterium]
MDALSRAGPRLFAPARLRDAAAVILVRGSRDQREVFWVRRGRGPAFAGFHAFPGGSVDEADGALPVAGLPADQASLFVAAVRELFEETGVLLARGSGIRSDLSSVRRGLLEGRLGFGEALQASGACLDPALVSPAGRWITPDFAPVRFDARFFLARLPEGQHAEVWPGELASGEWLAPSEALRCWERGQALLHPPALHILRSLASADDDELLEALRRPRQVIDHVAQRIELQRGIRSLPLRTPTLPPASHTSCYLIGDREMLLVDPGSDDPAENMRMVRQARALRNEGRRLLAVVLTHHHRDHVLGSLVAKNELGAPVWAHRLTAEKVGGVDRLLEDGEELALGGELPMLLRVLHTPGHASGHLCLFEEQSRALLCGDMLSGASTIVIDPPDGDMELYLASLERLCALGPRTLFPAHGEVMPDGPERLAEAIAHRRWREERLLQTLSEGPLPLAELTRRAYSDVAPAALPFAERSTLASLSWLERRGRISRLGALFCLA